MSENGDREMALQNVLTFIAEQQKYVQARDNNQRPCSGEETTKDFNIEAPPQEIDALKSCECNGDVYISNKSHLEETSGNDENYVTLKQLCTEFNLNEQNAIKDSNFRRTRDEEILQSLAYAEEVCLVTPIDVESENCSNMSERPVDICTSVSVGLVSAEFVQGSLEPEDNPNDNTRRNTNMESSDISTASDLVKSSDTASSGSPYNGMSESLTSSNSTPDTIVSKIPRRKPLPMPSKIPISPAKVSAQADVRADHDASKLPKSKIPYKNSKVSRPKSAAQKQKLVHVQPEQPQHAVASERLPQAAPGAVSNIIDGPPHRAVSFHERATSKDVIEELNRMIKNGDESSNELAETPVTNVKLDEACKPTGWVHVERDVDLNDPKVSTARNRTNVQFHRSVPPIKLRTSFENPIFLFDLFPTAIIYSHVIFKVADACEANLR